MEIEDNTPHLLDEGIKKCIINLKNKGLKNSAVAREAAYLCSRPTLSHQTVKNLWEKYQENENTKNQWNEEGRSRALDP